jgi:hypothetical protein
MQVASRRRQGKSHTPMPYSSTARDRLARPRTAEPAGLSQRDGRDRAAALRQLIVSDHAPWTGGEASGCAVAFGLSSHIVPSASFRHSVAAERRMSRVRSSPQRAACASQIWAIRK